jgi:two-component system, sensor histidine kinase LadS
MIRRVGDDIEFETDIDKLDGAFPADKEINVYRIIQESINNIVKHSKANHVIIRIKRATGAIEMFIQDNGKGFESSRFGKGFGLIGLAERARMLGGDFSIQSAPGQGTTINISLSIKDNGAFEETLENDEHN